MLLVGLLAVYCMLGVGLGLFLLIYLFAVLVGCMFWCFDVVCCVVYMRNSDWLILWGVVDWQRC